MRTRRKLIGATSRDGLVSDTRERSSGVRNDQLFMDDPRFDCGPSYLEWDCTRNHIFHSIGFPHIALKVVLTP